MQRFIEHKCAYNDSQYYPALRIEISDSQTSVGAHSRYKHTQRETHRYDEDTDTNASKYRPWLTLFSFYQGQALLRKSRAPM